MDKVLSIIVPTYNMEKLLRRCLASLLVSDENMGGLEVLIINDGSSDESSSLGHAYESEYPQTFRVIDKENGNYGSCVNRGLREMTGKYVRILDADDYFDTTHLDRFITMLRQSNADLVLSDMVSVYADGGEIRHTFDFVADTVYDSKLLGQDEFKNKMEMHHVTYKKTVLDTLDYQQTEGISYTDQEWIFYPMMAVGSISYFPEVIYVYMLDREGQTMDIEVEMRRVGHKIAIARRMIGFLRDRRFDEVSREGYVRCRLGRFLRLIYKLVLLYQTEEQYLSHSEELRILDQDIRKSIPGLYDEMNSYVISSEIPMKFVKYWRVRRCRYPLFVLKLHRQVKGLDVLLRKMHLRG